MTTQLLSIGELASTVGLNVSAVRYYDDIGLIDSTTRIGGKRRFTEATSRRLSFILRCKDAGFALEEIRSILDEDPGWRQLIDDKLDDVASRRERLDQMTLVLTDMQSCGCEAISRCPGYLAAPARSGG